MNKALRLRLDAIEAKLLQAATEMERKRTATPERDIDPERARRTYLELVKAARNAPTDGSNKVTTEQAFARYLRLIRQPIA